MAPSAEDERPGGGGGGGGRRGAVSCWWMKKNKKTTNNLMRDDDACGGAASSALLLWFVLYFLLLTAAAPVAAQSNGGAAGSSSTTTSVIALTLPQSDTTTGYFPLSKALRSIMRLAASDINSGALWSTIIDGDTTSFSPTAAEGNLTLSIVEVATGSRAIEGLCDALASVGENGTFGVSMFDDVSYVDYVVKYMYCCCMYVTASSLLLLLMMMMMLASCCCCCILRNIYLMCTTAVARLFAVPLF